jgi:hypothetical protein
MTTHLLACIWVYLGEEEGGWITLTGHDATPNIGTSTKKYTTSLYWILTSFTTVGYGDLSPSTTLEIGFTMCCVV